MLGDELRVNLSLDFNEVEATLWFQAQQVGSALHCANHSFKSLDTVFKVAFGGFQLPDPAQKRVEVRVKDYW